MAGKSIKFPLSSANGNRNAENLGALVTKLEAELEEERKVTKQLRREKQTEVQRTKEEEQTKASIAFKNLNAKLNEEKKVEVELLKESLKCKLEADFGKVTKQKDQEIKKLKQDLTKVQNDLKEEITKRGLSTSVRGSFETERHKLLQEINELKTSKKGLEAGLQVAEEKDKQKSLEIRRIQENCKQEISKIERETRNEVRKLLDELKAKDNMLVMMDRSQYPDKASALKHQVENLNIEELLALTRELEHVSSGPDDTLKNNVEHSVMSTGCAMQNITLQKRVYELEKQMKFSNGLHKNLINKNRIVLEEKRKLEDELQAKRSEVSNLNMELAASRREIWRLNEALTYSKQVTQNVEIVDKTELETCRRQYDELENILTCLRKDCEDKDRQIDLLLKSQQRDRHRGYKKIVRFFIPEDKPQQTSNEEVAADNEANDELLIQNIYKDYEILMMEHLQMQKYYAEKLEANQLVPDKHNEKESWLAEKRVLQSTVSRLEQELCESEGKQSMLQCELQEAYDENEEMEFRLLELEENADKSMAPYYEHDDMAVIEKVRNLQNQLNAVQRRLAKYEDVEDIEMNVIADESQTNINHHTLSAENLRKLSSSLSDSDDDDAMIQSFSTMTSGFDEVSNISLDMDDRNDVTQDEIEPPSKHLKRNLCRKVEKSCKQMISDLEHLTEVPSPDPTEQEEDLDKSEVDTSNKDDKVKDLQEQVDLLEEREIKYKETLDKLAVAEAELGRLASGEKPTTDERRDVVDSVDLAIADIKYWANCCEAINVALTDVEESFLNESYHTKNAVENETLHALETCLTKLKDTCKYFSDYRQTCSRYELRIQELETENLSKADNLDFALNIDNAKLKDTSYEFAAHTSKLPSLKQCAFNAVIKCFQCDFSELKHLTQQYFTLNNISEEPKNTESCESKACSDFFDKVCKAKLSLNVTSIPPSEPRFDFLSPTNFDCRWTNESQMETINQCLLQQIQDLERDKNELKETIYIQCHSITELQNKITDFNDQKSKLQSEVENLMAKNLTLQNVFIEKETELGNVSEKVSQFELKISQLTNNLFMSENSEHSLKQEIADLRDDLDSKLESFKQKNKQWEEVKKEQLNDILENCSTIDELKLSESRLKQKTKSLEIIESKLKGKIEELEVSLNSACNEVVDITRRRDSISQRADFLSDENKELTSELVEVKDRNNKNDIEIERLTESENFLKEANRKLWLSLQAAIDEKEKKRLDEMISRNIENNLHDYQSHISVEHQVCGINQSVYLPTHGLRKGFLFLSKYYPESLIALIKIALSDSKDFDKEAAMQKFVSTLSINLGREENTKTDRDAETDIYDDDREKEFWRQVEDLNDLYDMRIAQQDVYWKEVESIMGASKGGMVLQLRDILLSQYQSTDGSNSTQTNTAQASQSRISIDETQPQLYSKQPRSEEKYQQLISSLRDELEEKDKHLSEKVKEIDKLNQEIELCQKQISFHSNVKESNVKESNVKESNVKESNVKESNDLTEKDTSKESRSKAFVSQIPVSVRQPLELHKQRDSPQQSFSTAASSSTLACSEPAERQGSVNSTGSTLTKPLKFTSYIQRPIEQQIVNNNQERANCQESQKDFAASQPSKVSYDQSLSDHSQEKKPSTEHSVEEGH